MAKTPSNQRKTPKSGEPKRAAVYVDELLPVEERQQELVNILRNAVKNPEHYDGIIVYGRSSNRRQRTRQGRHRPADGTRHRGHV